MNKTYWLIILILLEIGCGSQQSISRKDPTEPGFHRAVLAQVDSVGRAIPVHVVLFATDLFTDMSFLALAQDTAKPEIVSFIIAAKDSSAVRRIGVIDSAGNMINFSDAKLSRLQNFEWKHGMIVFTHLTWDKFNELCRIDSIRIETVDLRMFLGKSIMHDLNFLRDYLVERDPNEPPSDNPIDDEVEPTVLKRIEPIYPPLALQVGLEGDVTVKVRLNRQGSIREAVVQKSTAEIFDSSAVQAALKWEFTPAKILGRPVSVWVAIPFRFRMLPKEEMIYKRH